MGLSKRLRFEVFKRDCFRCQYCGVSGTEPGVILHADHIVPKCEGGEDSLLNLTTACAACNQGKSGVPLKDTAASEKQLKQAQIAQLRNEQAKMIAQWVTELEDSLALEVQTVAQLWTTLTGYAFNERGLTELKNAIRRYGVQEVIFVLRVAVDCFYWDDAGERQAESVEYTNKMAFKMLCNRHGRKTKITKYKEIA